MSGRQPQVVVIDSDASRRAALAHVLRDHAPKVASTFRELGAEAAAKISVVVAEAAGAPKLMREMDRSCPDAMRVFLCPMRDREVVHELVEIAAEGHHFHTVDADLAPDELRSRIGSLIRARADRRIEPSRPVHAEVLIDDTPYPARVLDVGHHGIGLGLGLDVAIERLAPGTRLERLRVLSASAPILEVRNAQVRHVGLHRVDGEALFRLGVVFPRPVAQIDAEGVRDPVRVLSVLRRALRRGCTFTLQGCDPRRPLWSGVDLALSTTEQGLSVGRSAAFDPSPGQVFELSFAFSGHGYRGQVSVLERGAEEVTFSLPSPLERRHRRGTPRFAPDPALPLVISFRSPLTGERVVRNAVDLQTHGVGIELDAQREPLPIGLRLDDVQLSFGAARTFRCRGEVKDNRAVQSEDVHRVGIQLAGVSDDLREAILEAFLRTRCPAVIDAEQVPFARVWRMMDEAGRRSPDYPAHDGPHVERIGAAQSALARARGALGKSVVWVDDDRLIGYANGTRVYSRTWLLQHLAVVPGYRRDDAVSQKLSSLIVEYGEALEDIDYLRYTWFSHVRWTARLSTWVARKIHVPGLSQIKHSRSFRLPPESTCHARRRLPVRTARRSDLAWLEAHFKASGDVVGLKAEDLRAEELEMASLSERSARVGLERGRAVFVIDGESGPLGFALCEHGTPGIVWAEFNNAFRLVVPDPNHARAAEVREALIARAVDFYRDLGRERLFALVSEPNASALEAAGFLPGGELAEWTFHKSLARSWDQLATAIFERLTTRRGGEGAERSEA